MTFSVLGLLLMVLYLGLQCAVVVFPGRTRFIFKINLSNVFLFSDTAFRTLWSSSLGLLTHLLHFEDVTHFHHCICSIENNTFNAFDYIS